MTTTSSILGGAFGLVARRPGAVLVWVLIHAALGIGSAALVAQVLPQTFAMLSQIDFKNPDAAPQAAMLSSMGNLQALSWLLSLASYFVGAILLCAAFRAVLRPEASGFAALRLGWDEVRTFLTMVVLLIGGGILAGIAFLIVFLIAMVVFFVLRDSAGLAVLVCSVIGIVAVCAALYVAVRLSLIFAVSFIRSRLTLDEAWAVTRGRFWKLFLAYLAISLVLWVVSMAVFMPFYWSAFSTLVPLLPPPGGDAKVDPSVIQGWFVQNRVLLGAMVVVLSGLQGVSGALMGGAMATAARGFMVEDGLIEDEAN